MICVMCTYGDHKGHDISPIVDYIPICKTELEKGLKVLKDRTIQLKQKNKWIPMQQKLER